MPAPRYSLGIDLGTTNSVLAYTRLPDGDDELPSPVELLSVPQLVAAGTVEGRDTLPSFLYLGTDDEAGRYDLPWSSGDAAGGRTDVVGEAARRRGAEVPDRTVATAKSWLAHSGVDRHDAILPWDAPAEVPKVSPVEASRRYLAHLAAAWDAAHPDDPLAEQAVTLTVPASFDAAARELTREAALAAGLPADLTLLEEPQAALYAWLADRGDDWRKDLSVGDAVLVCDVGGGTTDLSLVSVAESDGDLTLERVAVGRHLLVGGDNMDLALAHHVAGLFAANGTDLDAWQNVALWHATRAAKETLLAPGGPDHAPVAVLGRGRKLIGGTVSANLPRDDAVRLVLDGFFPEVAADAAPARRQASGFVELGLPYESDPAVTRHLAAFLRQHGEDLPDGGGPTHVLFNGGVFKSDPLRDRLLGVLGGWFPSAPVPLTGTAGTPADLDHAVARGAAFYGRTKRAGGVRIRGGTARSYYVGVESGGLAIPGVPRPLNAVCVVPFGMEEGTDADVPGGEVGLTVGEESRFRFFATPDRHADDPGDVLTGPAVSALNETDPVVATLDSDADGPRHVPVRFHSAVNELGLLELWCVEARPTGDEPRRWKLEFSVRDDS